MDCQKSPLREVAVRLCALVLVFAVLQGVQKTFADEKPLSRIRALELMLSYFPEKAAVKPAADEIFRDVTEKSPFRPAVLKACALGLLSCRQSFLRPNRPIDQSEWLRWLALLRGNEDGMTPEIKWQRWREARTMNWLELGPLTRERATAFLERYRASVAFGGLPYRTGLMAKPEDVSATRFKRMEEITLAQKSLAALDRKLKKDPSKTPPGIFKKLAALNEAYQTLKEDLAETPLLLRTRDDFSETEQEVIRAYGLQEVVGSHTYDLSKNMPYRQYNIRTALAKLDGLVLMPGEEVDYWKILKDQKLNDFKSGWTIVNGKDTAWEVGGGICGSSTITYQAAFRAGLEIVERRQHTVYYANLYPIEEIGLDAAVYLPSPNLRIRNNFNDPVLLNLTDDRENGKITLEVIGNSPYLNVALRGPFFAGKTRVWWVREIEHFDGTIEEEVVESRYNFLR